MFFKVAGGITVVALMVLVVIFAMLVVLALRRPLQVRIYIGPRQSSVRDPLRALLMSSG